MIEKSCRLVGWSVGRCFVKIFFQSSSYSLEFSVRGYSGESEVNRQKEHSKKRRDTFTGTPSPTNSILWLQK